MRRLTGGKRNQCVSKTARTAGENNQRGYLMGDVGTAGERVEGTTKRGGRPGRSLRNVRGGEPDEPLRKLWHGLPRRGRGLTVNIKPDYAMRFLSTL